jgi:hypothetical protein
MILKIQERRSKMLGYDYEHKIGYPKIEPNILDGLY